MDRPVIVVVAAHRRRRSSNRRQIWVLENSSKEDPKTDALASFFCVRYAIDWGSSPAAARTGWSHSLWTTALGTDRSTLPACSVWVVSARYPAWGGQSPKVVKAYRPQYDDLVPSVDKTASFVVRPSQNATAHISQEQFDLRSSNFFTVIRLQKVYTHTGYDVASYFQSSLIEVWKNCAYYVHYVWFRGSSKSRRHLSSVKTSS